MRPISRLAVLSSTTVAKNEFHLVGSVARRAFIAKDTAAWAHMRCRINDLVPRGAFSEPSVFRSFTSTSRYFQDEKSRPSTESASSTATLSTPEQQKSWRVPERVRRFVNDMLVETSNFSQAYHKYMGTDRSKIEELGRRIGKQEQIVLDCYQAVQDARKENADAILEQSNAQKEIVRLLERKSSWSPEDLERYMSLVRSEHLNDQAVVSARERVQHTEVELEQSRTLVGQLRAGRDHEEKIWGYTTLGNGTFVTIALMGVNIGLLLFSILVQVVIIEPRRMRKVERAVKAAIDQGAVGQVMPEVERQIDQTVGPSSSLGMFEASDKPATTTEVTQTQESDESAKNETHLVRPPIAVEEGSIQETMERNDSISPTSTATLATAFTSHNLSRIIDLCREIIHDLFSERIIQLRKIEVTVILLQGTITSLGVLFLLLRPR